MPQESGLYSKNSKDIANKTGLKSGGRYEDFAKATVVRSLGLVLVKMDGGFQQVRKGSLVSRSGFVVDACGELGIDVKEWALENYLAKLEVKIKEHANSEDNQTY